MSTQSQVVSLTLGKGDPRRMRRGRRGRGRMERGRGGKKEGEEDPEGSHRQKHGPFKGNRDSRPATQKLGFTS